MRNLLLAGAAALVLAGAASSASASIVTVDFSGFPTGTPIDDIYNSIGLDFTPNAEILQCGGGCPNPNPNGFFAYAFGSPFTVFFSTPQTDVSFQTVSFSNTVATAFDASNNQVAQITDVENFPISQQVDHLLGAGITSVVFSSGGGNGAAPTNLTFDSRRAFNEGGVPEPITWSLMIAGFGLAGAQLRLRNRVRAAA